MDVQVDVIVKWQHYVHARSVSRDLGLNQEKPRFTGLFACARVDSNHHGEISPKGPQPWARPSYASALVQTVRIVRELDA
jgi:hypothetical protein